MRLGIDQGLLGGPEGLVGGVEFVAGDDLAELEGPAALYHPMVVDGPGPFSTFL